ncbi:hypothetical protein Avbf_12956 [Armadillidium vulgare]|nr:hypothetical protein Avbf_12956 [Armadillidium vulgare]
MEKTLGWIWILFVIAGCGTCILLYCLFVEQVVFAAQCAHHVYRNSLIWIASVYPFMTLMTLVGFFQFQDRKQFAIQ